MRKQNKGLRCLKVIGIASVSLLLFGGISNISNTNTIMPSAKASYFNRSKHNFDVYLRHRTHHHNHRSMHHHRNVRHHNHKHSKKGRGYFHHLINKLRRTKSHRRRIAIYRHILRMGKNRVNKHEKLKRADGVLFQNLAGGTPHRMRKKVLRKHRKESPSEQSHLIRRIRYAMKKANYYYHI